MQAFPRQVGRYRVVGSIASGGHGTVLEGFDQERRLPVALKTVRVKSGALEVALRREFRVASEIWHPNIVRLYELFEHEGVQYLSMERLEPTPLDEWWGAGPDGGRPADPERLVHAARQLALGVATLHAAGLLHLDLKPHNALVQPDGRVVLIDFGLAAREGEWTDYAIGTPGYMAPELMERTPLDAAVDWYAFGVILHDALSGRRLRDDVLVHDPRSYRADADPGLSELAMALVQVRPERRPGGDEVLTRLGLGPVRTRSAPFVGRAAELAALTAALGRAAEGRVGVVHLTGPSGIGKSGVVEELHRREVARATVLYVRCSEREAVPYKVLDPLIDDVVRALRTRSAELDRDALAPLAAAFPETERLGLRWPGSAPPPERRVVAAALGQALRAVAAYRPVLCLVDDAQWADDDSAVLLAEALALEPRLPVLVVLALRAGLDPGGLAARLGRPEAVVALGPLPADDVQALVQASAAVPPEPAAVEEVGGDPFLLSLLLGGVTAGAERSLADALATRVAGLSDGARRMLACVALAAFPVSQALLARLAARPVDPLLDGLHAARLARVHGTGAGARVEVVHDRVRALVVGALGRQEQVEVHRLLLGGLGDDADAAARAHHAFGAGELELGARTARAAGREALKVLAFERAVELLALARQHTPEPDPALHRELGEALEGAGRCGEAARAYELAAPVWPELRLRAARMHFFSGGVEDGLAAAAPVLAEYGLALPETPRGVLAAIVLGMIRATVGASAPGIPARSKVASDVEDGLVSMEPMRAAALLLTTAPGDLRSPDPALRALARSRIGLFWAGRGRVATGVAAQRQAMAETEDAAPPVRLKVLVNGAKLALIEGHFAAARDLADAARSLAEAHRCESVLMPSVTRNVGLFATAAMGELDELAGRVEEARRRGLAVGDRCAEVTADLYAALLCLAAGEPDRAEALIAAAVERWPVRRYTFQHWLADRTRCLAAAYEGDGPRVRAQLARARRGLADSRMGSIPFIASEVIRLRMLAGERGLALRWAVWRAGEGAGAHAASARVLAVALGGSAERARSACEAAGLRMHRAALDPPGALAGVADPPRWLGLYLPRDGALPPSPLPPRRAPDPVDPRYGRGASPTPPAAVTSQAPSERP